MVWVVCVSQPALQTLIVLSLEPDMMVNMMVVPSGEKATELMLRLCALCFSPLTEATIWLCALCFSALSSMDAATNAGAVRFGLRVRGCQC